MNCQEARAQAIEYARSGAPRPGSHFDECAECARFLTAQLAMQSAFAELAGEFPAAAGEDLEAALLAEFDAGGCAIAHAAPRGWRWWEPAAACALAASLVAAAVAIRHPASSPDTAQVTQPSQRFVEIPYIAPLAPYERTEIVRMDVPLSALIAAGFEVHAADAGATLKADVLFGQDGRARAIRPLSNSISNSNRRIIR